MLDSIAVSVFADVFFDSKNYRFRTKSKKQSDDERRRFGAYAIQEKWIGFYMLRVRLKLNQSTMYMLLWISRMGVSAKKGGRGPGSSEMQMPT